MMGFENNSGALSLGDIIEGRNFLIPLYQRGYKWDEECSKKLFVDLVNSFKTKEKKSVGLITLYRKENGFYDVIDGQQRLITFSIIFRLMGTTELIDKIMFERDNNEERKNAINNVIKNKIVGFTDGDRMLRNANAILEMPEFTVIKREGKAFIKHIKEKCFMLCSVVKQAATEEFMNLNAYKTPFSICDHMRSNLISLNTFYKDSLEAYESLLAPALGGHSYKTAVAKLYNEIIDILYCNDEIKSGEYKSVYNVVGKECDKPEDTKESRINIIFTELIKKLKKDTNKGYRCDSINFNSDEWIKQLIWISYTKNLLAQLEKEMKKGNFSSAKLIDDYCRDSNNSFFSLISKDVKIEEQSSNDLAKILDKKNSINNVIFGDFSADDIKKPNLYFEALCTAEHNKPTNKSYYSHSPGKDCLNLKLDQVKLSDCIQSSGKYIIDKFLKDQQRSQDAFFQISPIIDFEDRENPRFDENIQNEDEWPVVKLFECDVAIPIIQRDYCMGALISTNEKNEDFLAFIINSFEKETPITASTIIIAIDKNTQKRYIFDGQQRSYTLYQILKYLKCKELKRYEFIGRNEISEELIHPKNYIEESVINLRKAIGNRCKDISSLDEFEKFIKENVKFKVKVISEISAAEQFFMDINGGVPLENYEIFKSCLINSLPDHIKESWVKKLENEWLNFFYLCKDKIYKNIANNYSEEELIEMRFIEYVCRWLYKKRNLNESLPNCFDSIASKSELITSLEYLKKINFNEIKEIIEKSIEICKQDDLWYVEEKIIKTKIIELKRNSSGDRLKVGYAYLEKDKDISNSDRIYFLRRFIRSCSELGRKSYFVAGDKKTIKHEAAINYYDEDIIIDYIFNNILKINSNINLKYYELSKLNNKIYILGGYKNWSSNLEISFEYMTEKELPIYYVDYFFNNEEIISYYNLYTIYNNALESNKDYKEKIEAVPDSVYLFLLTQRELYFDKGGIFKGDFKRKKEYTNGYDFTISFNNNPAYNCFLNQRSAYSIRFKNGETTIIDKI
jgi:hypothetical protein